MRRETLHYRRFGEAAYLFEINYVPVIIENTAIIRERVKRTMAFDALFRVDYMNLLYELINKGVLNKR